MTDILRLGASKRSACPPRKRRAKCAAASVRCSIPHLLFGLPTFGYGGRVGESQNGISYSSDGEATVVQPLLINNDSLGHDKFIFRQNLTTLNLPDGQHSFVAKIKDVNNNSVESSVVDFDFSSVVSVHTFFDHTSIRI